MITEAIADLLILVVSGMVGLLPDAGPLDLSSFAGAISAFRAFNSALPVAETLAMAGTTLLIVGGIFVWRVLVTVYGMIPFKFT